MNKKVKSTSIEKLGDIKIKFVTLKNGDRFIAKESKGEFWHICIELGYRTNACPE